MNKTFLYLLTAILISSASYSQENTNVKSPALSIQFFFNDFKSASAIRSSSLNSALLNKKIGVVKDMVPGLGINYLQGISPNFDFSASLGGSFLDYVTDTKTLGKESLLLEADASINAKMLPDQYWVVPYLSAGVGVSKYKGYYGSYIPLGAGIQINFFNDAYFIVNTQYRLKVSETTSNHFFSSIGIAGSIGSGKD